MKIGTERAKHPAPHGVSRPGPRCEDRTHFESFTHSGQWDRPEWRSKNGHPQLRVKFAYTAAWSQAIAAGASLEFAHEYAGQAAARAAKEEG